MSGTKGMNVGAARAKASELASQLSTIDHIISELRQTKSAALNPQGYGIESGGPTIAPWSVASVSGAKTELSAARAAIEELVRRIHTEADAQVQASGNGFGASKLFGRAGVRTRSELASLSDQELLDYLAGLTAAQLAAALAADPSIAERIEDMPPELVAPWWNSYSSSHKQALIDGMPKVLGNLEGVEYWARDEANRLNLKEFLDDGARYVNLLYRGDYAGAAAILAATGLDEESYAKALLAAQSIDSALKAAPAGGTPPIRQLVSFTLTDGEPVAAISVGDLDAADNITVMVPGISNNVANNMEGWTSAAQSFYNEQVRMEALLSADGSTPTSVATIAWMGYDTPDGAPEVWDDGFAQRGGASLAAALDGVRASRQWGANPPGLDVLAHSYGSTVAMNALTTSSAGSLIMYGSAGAESSIGSVADLNLAPGEVYATESPLDPWAGPGRLWLRTDPLSPDFGAQYFSSQNGTDYFDSTVETFGTTGHDAMSHRADGSGGYGYLDAGTESRENMVLITLGYGDLFTGVAVPTPTPQSPPHP